MTVRVKKRSPLTGVPNAAQIAGKIAVLLDTTESYQTRKDAAGWLRGCWDVTRRTPKYKKAADYINDILKQHRYPEDTTGA